MMRAITSILIVVALIGAAAAMYWWLKPHCKEVTWYAFGNSVTLENCE